MVVMKMKVKVMASGVVKPWGRRARARWWDEEGDRQGDSAEKGFESPAVIDRVPSPAFD